jgi:4-hydroxy-2-oxoglutarate aldolase
VVLPFPTPFQIGGGVDLPALRSNIERWNHTGVNGYVALGSTGERVHLEERECLEVLEATREAVPRNMVFIAGAGQASTIGTIREVRNFAEAGADAVLVITPHFYRSAMTQMSLVDYYRAVADASPVPVLLYSMPPLTGISLAAETVARLAEHRNIIGIKDSSADIVNLAETIRLVPREFAVLTGNGPSLYVALCSGAAGAILAAGCVAPRLAVTIYRAAQGGDHHRALECQRKFTPLAQAVTVRHGIGGLKAALDMAGYQGGFVRAPLQPAGEETRFDLARLLEESSIFEDESPGTEERQLTGVSSG